MMPAGRAASEPADAATGEHRCAPAPALDSPSHPGHNPISALGQWALSRI
jgi:hypothetical protein